MSSPTTPTTAELSDAIVAQISAAISQTIPLLPKSWTRVVAKVLAGTNVLTYRYAGFAFLQQFIRTASYQPTEINGESVRPLIELGRRNGTGDPIAAVRAELVIDVTVTTQTGSLAAGSQVLKLDTETLYQTAAAVPLSAATVQATIVAAVEGSAANLQVGDQVEFAGSQPNVETIATVASVTVLGVDEESEDEYRARVLATEQAKPQGGAYADYRQWGRTVAGVENIYPYTGAPGEMDVYVEAQPEIDPDGIPSTVLLTSVYDAIQLDVAGQATNRPGGAGVNTLAISRTPIDVTVTGLSVPDPTKVAAVQQSIQDGVDEHLRGREPFIVGLSVLPRKDTLTQGSVGGVVNGIANAEGATVSDVAISVGGSAFQVRVLQPGEKTKLGTITFPTSA